MYINIVHFFSKTLGGGGGGENISVRSSIRVQYILLKYKKYIQLYNGYIQITKYINKLHNNNKVYIYIDIGL